VKITEKEFRRLHFRGRVLDRICLILWPNGQRPKAAIDCVLAIEDAIGDYRPGPEFIGPEFLRERAERILSARQDEIDRRR